MTSRQFVFRTLALSTLISALIALCNWGVDFYGLYRDTRGQARTVVSNERFTKYLYAFNQIPTNFDGLLVGSSISANIDTSLIKEAKTYNLSMAGANISEQEKLLAVALPRGEFKLVVFSLTPYLVKDHGLKAGGMDPRDFWAGLGSLPLVEDYLAAGVLRVGLLHPRFDAFGHQDLELSGAQPRDADEAMRSELGRLGTIPGPAYVDPIAHEDLVRAIDEARRAGARIVGFFPPVYAPRYRGLAAQFARFEGSMRQLFQPNETIIDFNDGSFAEFSGDRSNFLDGMHYARSGAAKLSVALSHRIASR